MNKEVVKLFEEELELGGGAISFNDNTAIGEYVDIYTFYEDITTNPGVGHGKTLTDEEALALFLEKSIRVGINPEGRVNQISEPEPRREVVQVKIDVVVPEGKTCKEVFETAVCLVEDEFTILGSDSEVMTDQYKSYEY